MTKPQQRVKAREETVTEEVTAKAVKLQLGALLSRAGFGNIRFSITRHGKPIAALVSAEDLKRLKGAA